MNTSDLVNAAPPPGIKPGLDSRPGQVRADSAISIYQVHLNSWRRVPEDRNRPLTSEEIGPQLAPYVRFLGFTHVELLSPEGSSPPPPEPVLRCLRECEVESLPGSRPGLALQWDRDWAFRTLTYFGLDPLYRKFHHELITDRRNGPAGNLILPLSHEFVAPGRQSLLARMPGDEWQKFANLRLLFAFMYAMPGGKLLFMGGEFAQANPWNPATSLDWHLVSEWNLRGKLQRCVAALNRLYRAEPALRQAEPCENAFSWIDVSDAERSIVTLLRRSAAGREAILAAFNFTPVPRHNYCIGVPQSGLWKEVLNSDAIEYGGSGQGNQGAVEAAPFGWQGQSHSLFVTLPPLAAVFFKQPLPAS